MRNSAFDIASPFWLLCFGAAALPAIAGAQTKRSLGTGHSQPVVALAFSPDGTTLASASVDMSIILWDVQSASVRHTLKGHTKVPGAVAFSADGKTLVSCGRSGHQIELRRWATADGEHLETRKLQISNILSVDQPTFSRDGRRLANTTNILGHPYVRVWDVATGNVIAEYRSRSSTKMGTRPPSLAFSPDSETVATVESKHTVRLVNVANDRDESFPKKLTACRSAIFSPDGKTIAAVFWQGRALGDGTAAVALLDVATKKITRTFSVGSGRTEVVLSPDGALLASIGKGIKVWDVKTGTLKAQLLSRFQRTYGHQRLAFSPDGRRLATPNGSRVEIWDVAEFK